MLMWTLLMCAKSSTKKAVEWTIAAFFAAIGFILAMGIVLAVYAALYFGADLTSTVITVLILIILIYVVFFIANAFSKKSGDATSAAAYAGIGFTIGLIVISIILAYFDIASSLTIGTQ